jgi:hypothetical protein
VVETDMCGELPKVALRLGAEHKVEGRIVDMRGHPVPGAWAAWSRMYPARSTNDAMTRIGWMRGFANAWQLLRGDQWIAAGEPQDRWFRFLTGFAPEDDWVEVRPDGSFTCAVPAAHLQVELVGVGRASDGKRLLSKTVRAEVGGTIDIELDVEAGK